VIQFQVLSGKLAGHDIVACRFPFQIGRGQESDLQLEEAGVWDQHLQVDFQRGVGFAFSVQSEALVLINGERVDEGILRNGDLIELGAARLRFWLARSRQRGMKFRESLTWTALVALFILQALLIWLLTR